MSARVLFASESGWGHVNPLIAIAGELTARGVTDVWFASNDEHRAVIEAIEPASADEPVHFVSLGPVKPEQEPVSWSDETVQRMMTGSPLRNLAAIIDLNLDYDHRFQRYQRMLEVLDEVRPALAVVDLFAYWAIDALNMRGIPYVAVCPGLASGVYAERLPWGYPTPLSGLPRQLSAAQKLHNVAFRLGRQAVGFRPKHLRKNVDFYRGRVAEQHKNPESKLSWYADGAIAVYAYGAVGFDYPFPKTPDNLRMIGTMIGPQRKPTDDDPELNRWLDEHESVVYAAFGTVMRLMPQQVRAIIDAAGRLGPRHQVLWKLPRSRQHLLPADLPSNLRVESWLPSQLDVLAHPHVRVFFNHGGDNGVQEGLYFGKPELVMPFWMDNLDNAARITDSGAGLAVADARDPDGRAIAAQLTRLLTEPDFAARAGQWRQRLHEAGGSGAAAEEIVATLGRVGTVRF